MAPNTAVNALKADLEASERLNAPPNRLLRLPFEIRLQIYHYCIPRRRIVGVRSPRFDDSDCTPDLDLSHNAVGVDSNPGSGGKNIRGVKAKAVYLEKNYWNRENQNSILLLSKQISGEALDVLYGDNTFKVHINGVGEFALKKLFTEANRQRMRYLMLIALPGGASYMPGKMPDAALWSSIISRLKALRIIARQPVQVSSYLDAPTLEENMDRWVKSIRPLLQWFGQRLSRETIVQVDINGHTNTRRLVEQCLPQGYQEIQCRHVGDLIFKRGQFSWDSGSSDDDYDRINLHDDFSDWDSD